jgi:hypothetical protein
MTSQSITMLTGLLSAAVGGAVALVSIFLTNRSNTTRLKVQLDHESQQRKIELLRSRGEELYELSDKWLKMFAGYYLRRLAVMQNKLTYKECFDLDIEGENGKSDYYGRIKMLVDVYFPSMQTAYDKINKNRDELNKIETSFRKVYENNNFDASSFIKPYVYHQQSIEQAGEEFKRLLLENIRVL